MKRSILVALILGAIELVRGHGTFDRPKYIADPDKQMMEFSMNKNVTDGRGIWMPLLYKVFGKLLMYDNELADIDGGKRDKVFIDRLEYFSFAAMFSGVNLYKALYYAFEEYKIVRECGDPWYTLYSLWAFVGIYVMIEIIEKLVRCIMTWGLRKFIISTIQFLLLSFLNYKIGVRWIELTKISKNSSRNLKILRWFLRAWAMFMAYLFPIMTISGGITDLNVSLFAPLFLDIIIVSSVGHFITKTFCEDRKDLEESEVIRRGVMDEVDDMILVV